jgi:putative PIN family toxin of toxin-antitoxin system
VLALRLILDTNVVVSAALEEEGFPRIALTIALSRQSRLYISQPVFDEYTDVLSRPELDIPKGQRLRLLQLIKNRSFLVVTYRRLEVTIDPDDNIFIECADAARADYLITGNRRQFPQFWKGTKVITPREFIEIAAPHLLRG